MKRSRLWGLAALALGAAASPASAYDWEVQGKVIMVEITYMPDYIAFQINVPAGSCGNGVLIWPAKGATAEAKSDNVQAALSVLLTAKATNSNIRIYGNNANCTIDYMHLI